MKALVVVEQRDLWPLDFGDVDVALAADYLAGKSYSNGHYDRIFNLCDYERYQGQGFYVSLLAEARGQQPIPTVKTIEDLQSAPLLRLLSGELEPLIQNSLRHDGDDSMHVDAYFGRDPTGRNLAIGQQLFALVKTPLLRAQFQKVGEAWQLSSVQALTLPKIPKQHHALVKKSAEEFMYGQYCVRTSVRSTRPSVAILYDGPKPDSPSNERALKLFSEAAERIEMKTKIIDQHAIEKLSAFDGLFIRDTTNLNHYTYQFSRRAAAQGLVVIDDPDSILQCNNKVYLHELLSRHHVPMPKSVLVHRENIDEILGSVGLPCILKQPDSAFSLGVSKAESESELRAAVDRLLQKSELIIAQEFVPTAFDWRVGVLDRRVLYVCKYFMAPNHWQVIKRDASGRTEGRTLAISVGEAPEQVVKTALNAANLIGSGFYGVDLKQVGNESYVIEVNDNPNVDAGNEDGVLGPALYREIMGVMKRRIQDGPHEQPEFGARAASQV